MKETDYTDGVLPAVYEPVSKDVDTATLVRMLQSKNEEAFQILYDKYGRALYGILMKFVHRTDVADALLREVFVKIWRDIDSFDPSYGTLFTWMLKITRKQALDYSGSSCKQQELAHVGKEPLSPHRATQLDTQYAEVIDMIFFYGHTFEQAARILNLPLDTVKARARKGLSILKDIYIKGDLKEL